MSLHKPSRRVFLRGAGVTVALPWLESLPVWGAPAAPKRFAVLFMGNGISGNHWWAKGSGSLLQLSRTLAPLEPVKQKINVINGLFNKPSMGRGVHPAQTGNLLSGAPLALGATVCAGTTIDQVIAARTGSSSLVLACEPPANDLHESGFSLAYSSYLSWSAPHSPVAAEIDPERAFDALFEKRGAGSVVDRVKDGAAGLERQVSSTDREKLDEYLADVREVERRVDEARKDGYRDVRHRARLLSDIVALAFQTDRTRVASLVLARDLSSLRYPFLDIRDDHHAMSHDDLSDGYERIARFHVGQFAYLAMKLDSMREGDGTVLDNCCLLFLSNMWSGWKHDNLKLPVLTAGGLGGTLQTGRALEYLHAGDEKRKLCSLYLSLLDRFGVDIARFGDSDRRLLNL